MVDGSKLWRKRPDAINLAHTLEDLGCRFHRAETVLAVVWQLDGQYGRCTAALATIARLARCCERTAGRVLAWAREVGLVRLVGTCTGGRGRTNVLQVVRSCLSRTKGATDAADSGSVPARRDSSRLSSISRGRYAIPPEFARYLEPDRVRELEDWTRRRARGPIRDLKAWYARILRRRDRGVRNRAGLALELARFQHHRPSAWEKESSREDRIAQLRALKRR